MNEKEVKQGMYMRLSSARCANCVRNVKLNAMKHYRKFLYCEDSRGLNDYCPDFYAFWSVTPENSLVPALPRLKKQSVEHCVSCVLNKGCSNYDSNLGATCVGFSLVFRSLDAKYSSLEVC